RVPRHPARVLPGLPGAAGGRQHARARDQRRGGRGGPGEARGRGPLGRGREQLGQAGALAAVGVQGPAVAEAGAGGDGGGGRGEGMTGVRTIRSSQAAIRSCQTPRLTFSYGPADANPPRRPLRVSRRAGGPPRSPPNPEAPMHPTLDRFRGALLGLAVGDALGTTLEFRSPGSFQPITDMVGGGPFGLEPGQWTDDTSMALCLAESLVERRGFDPLDQLERYSRWHDEGHLSSTGRCFDIGNTVRAALERYE